MFITSKDSKVKRASRAGKKSKKSGKMDQQSQESTLEEIDYLKTLQHDSDHDEELEETDNYPRDFEDNYLPAYEDEQPSESRQRTRQDNARVSEADSRPKTHRDDARVSEADEDKAQSVSNKKRKSQEPITGITPRFSLTQAEQAQVSSKPSNNHTIFTPSTSPSPDFVRADTQSVSSTNAYQGEFVSDNDNTILNRDLGRHGEVTGDGVVNTENSISYLERLIRVKSVADNKQKLTRGLEIIRSQETISLTDPDFLALNLNDTQLEEVVLLYESDPQPVKLSGSSMLLTQDIKRLSKGYTESNAVEFVQWVRSTDSGLKVNQLVDDHAKFTLDSKFKSMAHRFGCLPEYFTGWYENWTLNKLATWVEKLYGNVEITTLTEEVTRFQFNFRSKGMDLANPKSRPSEDATFQKLNEILIKYPGPEFSTPKVQTELVRILKEKVKHTLFRQDMSNNALPTSTAQEFILSLMSVREKIREDFEGAKRYNNQMLIQQYL